MKYYSFKLKNDKTNLGYPLLVSLRGYRGTQIFRKFCNSDVYVDNIADWDKTTNRVIGGKKINEKNTRIKQITTIFDNEILKFKVNHPDQLVSIEFLETLIRPNTSSDSDSSLIVCTWLDHISQLLDKQRYNTASQF